MVSRFLLASLISAILTGTAVADPIDDLVRTYMEVSHIPGAAIAVIEDGQITKLTGYGSANLEWDAPATAETPFQIASASKIFTGVVLMRLVEQGLVSLDAPLTDYLAEAPESWSAITLRRLAGHTSGLAEIWDMPTSASAAEVAAAAMKRPLAYEPGSQSRYGLTDFVVMTAVMEMASGLSYPDLIQREIVAPLGLTHTGFSMLREGGPSRMADIMPGRSRTYGWRDGVQRDEEFLYPVHAYSAGGLFTSARDVAVLMAALEGGRLLKPESFALLITPTKLNDGRDGDFGVGWTFERYHGLATVGHTGGPALADVMHIPSEGLTVIAMTNQRRFHPVLSRAIADLKLPPAPEIRAIRDRRPERTTALRQALEAFAGGQVDAALFTDENRAGLVGFYGDFGQAMLAAFGGIESLEVLSERVVENSQLRRLYRIRFQRRTTNFVVRTDADGRFAEIRPLSGDDA